jgi:hypothetical protein
MQDSGMQLLAEADYSPDVFQYFTATKIEKYREVICAAKIEPQ